MKFSNKPYKDRKPQTKGSNRNWQKARLMGFCIDISNLTPEEKSLVKQITNIKTLLLESWDKNTEDITGNKLKPYKCNFCGRRSNISHLLYNTNFCQKHYKKFKDVE